MGFFEAIGSACCFKKKKKVKKNGLKGHKNQNKVPAEIKVQENPVDMSQLPNPSSQTVSDPIQNAPIIKTESNEISNPIGENETKEENKIVRKQNKMDPELARKLMEKRLRDEKNQKKVTDNIKQMGPIYIPMEPRITQAANIPKDIILHDIDFDDPTNPHEMYIVGSVVDDIELEPSTGIESDDGGTSTEASSKAKTPATTISTTDQKTAEGKLSETKKNSKSSTDKKKKELEEKKSKKEKKSKDESKTEEKQL